MLDDPKSPILEVIDKTYAKNLLQNESIFVKPIDKLSILISYEFSAKLKVKQ